ncbi:MAG: chorismate synthase [Prevotellaceae bacterium]|jgi:chorismate synthase|nr:chorismate synthase [Prevotellaceae bacterium]
MNSFGRIFRVHIFGESHGRSVGVCIDGCPPGIPLSEADFAPDLLRRKSGAAGTTPRRESDAPAIISGTYEGVTTGAPVAVVFGNDNTISGDYARFAAMPRPGHADFTAAAKFGGYNDPRGGGHFSGRLTLGLVAAGTVAKKAIAPVRVEAKIASVGAGGDIEAEIRAAIAEGDSRGGIVECRISGAPAGLGNPFFDGVESVLAHILFAIPGVKGVEFGAGFAAAAMKGSEHNDAFASADGKTLTNNAGGVNGGIGNGNDITLRVAVKPTSSIAAEQTTFNFETGRCETLTIGGRHDVCFALRVPVAVEAAAAVVIADLMQSEYRHNR